MGPGNSTAARCRVARRGIRLRNLTESFHVSGPCHSQASEYELLNPTGLSVLLVIRNYFECCRMQLGVKLEMEWNVGNNHVTFNKGLWAEPK